VSLTSIKSSSLGPLLEKFRMESCNLCHTPMEVGLKLPKEEQSKTIDKKLHRQLVGGLIYLTTTRPDINCVVGILSIYLNALKTELECSQKSSQIHKRYTELQCLV
jgi:hypothetical protein